MMLKEYLIQRGLHLLLKVTKHLPDKETTTLGDVLALVCVVLECVFECAVDFSFDSSVDCVVEYFVISVADCVYVAVVVLGGVVVFNCVVNISKGVYVCWGFKLEE